MKTYLVYGDYGLETQNLLEDFDFLQEARNFIRGYTRWDDMGGYENIYIVDAQGKLYQAMYANFYA
jgi:hypothetical protein